MLKNLSVFLIFVFIFFLIQCNENKDSDNVFVPTKEWQVVRKGQKIPQGLHVRINLETGLTEAKLLDDGEVNEDKTKALTPVPQDPSPEVTTEDKFDPDEIKSIKSKFWSYAEIKKSLDQLNLTPKIDAEVIADLLKTHKEVLSAEKLNKGEVLNIIEDLDFLAHQYDNAREFVNQNGFHEVIYKNINGSNTEIRRETLKLMGSLMQNNVAPKIHALETGAIGVLLRLINFDSDLGVKNRALAALSALLRSFPVAQKNFIDNGGLTVLAKCFNQDQIKIQIKLITLISDLIIEHKSAINDENLSKYYAKFDLSKRVLEHDWCQNLNKLLLGLIITDKEDHDAVEKCLTAMHTLKVECANKFEKELLISLQKRYEILGSSDGDSDLTFFNSLKDLCDEILHYINKINVKTEL